MQEATRFARIQHIPNHCACGRDEAHEIKKRLLASQGESTEAFKFIGKHLNLMACSVVSPLYWRSDGTTGIAPDLSGCTELPRV